MPEKIQRKEKNMKNTAKKLLCLVLVIMLAIPFAAFPASAATAYGDADEGDLLYSVNFNGEEGVFKFNGDKYDGMDYKVSDGGKTISLKPWTTPSVEGSVWSGEFTKYKMEGNSYTVVFTVNAPDNQSVGLFAKWKDGIFVNPTANTYSVGHCSGAGADAEKYVAETSYEGTGDATQTYAIEIASGSTAKNGKYECSTYKLYAFQNYRWNLIAELDADTRADIAWNTTDYEFMIQLARVSKESGDNTGTVYVSDMNVYKGFAVAGGYLDETRAYYLANDGDLLYTVNFNGDEIYAVGSAWGGMDVHTVLDGGKAIRLRPAKSNEAAAFGKDMNTTHYPAKGNAYTMVFTASASDENQEVGLYPDWSTGFVVAPGKNMFKYNRTESDRSKNTTIVDYTSYNGTGELTQTYAIEYQLNDDFSAAEYNLYVAQGDEWVLLYSLNEDELAAGPNWSTTDYETVIRFYRDSKTYKQTSGTVTVSNVKIYKGLAAKSGAAALSWKSYAAADDGDLLYTVNFNGDKGIFGNIGTKYDGMDNPTTSNGGRTIALKAQTTPSVAGSVWSGEMLSYKIPGNAYTVVFTVNAPDNQSVGLFAKWKDGFFVNPTANTYSVGHCSGAGADAEKYVAETSYEGTGNATQTYAIEFASGTNAVSGTKLECTKYNLYVLQDGVWNLICALDEETRQKIAWDEEPAGDYEFMIQLARVSKTGEDNTDTVYVSDVNVYKGNDIFPELGAVTGASVRLDEPTGIRFTGSVNKTYYDALVAEHGAENVKIGMLITPRDYLVDNGLAFTKAALDDCDAISNAKYLEIDAVTVLDEGTHYKVNCAMVNVYASNYNRAFSARLYVKVNGEIYAYASYNAANNSRSIAEVAKAAYNDVKATADSVYKYATTLSIGTTVYSPYENRDVLANFFEEETGTSITVMSYNIRAFDAPDGLGEEIFGGNKEWAGRDVSYALETITELMPDVVGLQEDDSYLYAEYKNVPALEQNYARLNSNGNGNENLEILYKKGVFTLVDTGTVLFKELKESYLDDENVSAADFSLDDKGTNEAGRFFRWAILEKDGVQFLVVNTHLTYKGKNTAESSDAENKVLRKAQATLLRRWMDESDKAAGCENKIVFGDMNAQGNSQEMKYGYLNGTGALKLAADNALYAGDVGGTLISEDFIDRQPWVYDHIFYNGDLVAYEFSVVDNYDADAPTNYPSDHLPVIAKFICK